MLGVQILGKLHYMFLVFVHYVFRIINYGKTGHLPAIKDPLILESATALAAKIRKKKLKSADVVRAYFARIEDVNPHICAIAALRKEAIREAENIDRFIESGEKTEAEIERETPFLGVPFTSKEIIAVKGMPITAGAVHRKGLTADKDADPVRLLRKAGAIPIAVTNLGELGMWPESINKVYGTTSNAYNPSRTAGGSTGGEGALLGAAGSVIGLGSDIGGSVRIPTCFNGIFGHKTTAGIVSKDGFIALINPEVECFNSLGPMCRYATDLLPMLKVISCHSSDKLQFDRVVHLEKLKIYYIDDTSDLNFVTKLHPDFKLAVRKVVQHFEDTYKIKAKRLDLKYVQNSHHIYTAKVLEKGGFGIEPELFKTKKPINYIWEILLWMFCLSKHVFSILFMCILDKLSKKGDTAFGLQAYKDTLKMFQDILDENSVFIYPTWPEPAPYHNELIFKVSDFTYFTGIFNILQFPSTQCPMGLSREGLPVGVQVVGNLYNDCLTIAVAVELEKTFGGWVCSSPIQKNQ